MIMPSAVPLPDPRVTVPVENVPLERFKVPVLPLTLPTVNPPVAVAVRAPERASVPALTVVTPP